MAKQSGIHQLRGKVGGHSYYRQAGVTDGLMRKIPEGLSQAVKYGDNYVNARLNNAEFGSANRMAALAYNSVASRTSTMFRRFAIAEMTRKALGEIKKGSGDWGERIPNGTFDVLITDMLESHAKTGRYDNQFGVVIITEALSTNIEIELSISEEIANDLVSLGIDGMTVVPAFGACAETFQDGSFRLYGGHGLGTPFQVSFSSGAKETNIDVTPSPTLFGMSPMGYVSAQELSNFGAWAVLSFLPFRTINNKRVSIVEKATFVAVPLGNLSE